MRFRAQKILKQTKYYVQIDILENQHFPPFWVTIRNTRGFVLVSRVPQISPEHNINPKNERIRKCRYF